MGEKGREFKGTLTKKDHQKTAWIGTEKEVWFPKGWFVLSQCGLLSEHLGTFFSVTLCHSSRASNDYRWVAKGGEHGSHRFSFFGTPWKERRANQGFTGSGSVRYFCSQLGGRVWLYPPSFWSMRNTVLSPPRYSDIGSVLMAVSLAPRPDTMPRPPSTILESYWLLCPSEKSAAGWGSAAQQQLTCSVHIWGLVSSTKTNKQMSNSVEQTTKQLHWCEKLKVKNNESRH